MTARAAARRSPRRSQETPSADPPPRAGAERDRASREVGARGRARRNRGDETPPTSRGDRERSGGPGSPGGGSRGGCGRRTRTRRASRELRTRSWGSSLEEAAIILVPRAVETQGRAGRKEFGELASARVG